MKRTSTICINLKPKRENPNIQKMKKNQRKSHQTPTVTVIRITTNDKKYHFPGKKKITNKPSVRPKARVYKFNSIKKYFAPVYVSFKKPFKCFFHTFYSNWIFRKLRAKKSIIYKPCRAVQRMVIWKKRKENAVHNFRCCFSWFGGMPSIQGCFGLNLLGNVLHADSVVCVYLLC